MDVDYEMFDEINDDFEREHSSCADDIVFENAVR